MKVLSKQLSIRFGSYLSGVVWSTDHSEAPGTKVRFGRACDCAGRNASESRASLESAVAVADPLEKRGRPLGDGGTQSTEEPVAAAGVVGAACRKGVLGNVGGPICVPGSHPEPSPLGRRADRASDRPIVVLKRGNARGAKGPDFRRVWEAVKVQEIGRWA